MESVRVTDTKVSMDCEVDGSGFTSVLHPPMVAEGGMLFRGPRIALSVRTSSADAPGEAVRDAAAQVFLRFASLAFGDVQRALSRGAVRATEDAAGEAETRLDRFFRRADHTADWWKFAYFERAYADATTHFGPGTVRVQHGTRECFAAHPMLPLGPTRLFHTSRIAPAPRGRRFVHTDLDERAVLTGATAEVLTTLMETTIAREQPETIHLVTTCLPELIGDRPSGLVRHLERDRGVPVFWTAKTRDAGQSASAWLRRWLDAAEGTRREARHGVVLAGADGANAAEGTRLLQSLGLEVRGTLFPDLSARAVARAATAEAVVWLDPVGFGTLDDEAFVERVPVIHHHVPIGQAATLEWLARVARGLGVPGEAQKLAAVQAEFDDALAPIRDAAANKTVALVGDRGDIEALVRRSPLLDFSVARALAELGFRVQCLVYGADTTVVTAPRPLAAGSIAFRGFQTPASLRDVLADVDLVFTHFVRLPVLQTLGLPGFGEDVFAVGVRGLVRAGRRLLRLAAGRLAPLPGGETGVERQGTEPT